MYIMVWPLALALPKCVHLPYLRHVSPMKKIKDIWIAATNYYIYFYIIVLFPLTSILQLINFTASQYLVH